MKNTISNNMNYTGIVSLSQYSSGKKFLLKQIHNAGGDVLFNFLSDCLTGDFELAKISMPVKIMFLNITENDNGSKEFKRAANHSFSYLMTKPEKIYAPGAGTVRYSFMIPYDAVKGTEFNAIGLYADYAKEDSGLDDFAAYCMVDPDELNLSLSTSSALVVDWDLIISNANKVN